MTTKELAEARAELINAIEIAYQLADRYKAAGKDTPEHDTATWIHKTLDLISDQLFTVDDLSDIDIDDEPDIDDSLPAWAEFYPNESDYLKEIM